LPWLGGNT